MKSKDSKAQREVWEWKETAYNEIKNLPKEDQIPYILEKTKTTVEWIKKQKAKKGKEKSKAV